MTSIGWLHLSDLHATLRRPGWRAAALRGAVLDDLARLHDREGPWDLILVAGDLSTRGAPEELEEAGAALDELLAHLRTLGSVPTLLAVPGNHDLVRAQGATAAHHSLRRWHEDLAVREEFWIDPESPARRLVDRAFEPFERWWKERAARAEGVKDLRHGLLPGDFTATFEKDGVRLGIAGLCSAFLQVTGDDYEGRLGISPHQILIAAGGDVPAWIARHDASILITHHAPTWLSPDERRRYETSINPAGRFCAHLSGHVHEEDRLVEVGERLQIRSPSFFGIDAWEDRRGRPSERRYGYIAGRIDFEAYDAHLRIFPRIAEVKKSKPEYSFADLGAEGSITLPVARFPRLGASAPPFLLERAALRDAFAAVYPAPEDARRLAREAGVGLGKGTGGGGADVWQVVVSEADRKGLLADLVRITLAEYPDNQRVAEAWRACADTSNRDVPNPSVRRGSPEDNLSHELYQRLVGLPPVTFDAVVATLSIRDKIPGSGTPQATRAMAVVRLMEKAGRRGLERLAAALLNISARVVADAPRSNFDWNAFMLGLLVGGVTTATALLLLNQYTAAASRPRAPTKPSLTQLLNLMFTDERDFNGFVLDHFPAVYRTFTGGMNRAYRIRRLLDAADPRDVVARLKRSHPTAFSHHERVLDYEDIEDAQPGARSRGAQRG